MRPKRNVIITGSALQCAREKLKLLSHGGHSKVSAPFLPDSLDLLFDPRILSSARAGNNAPIFEAQEKAAELEMRDADRDPNRFDNVAGLVASLIKEGRALPPPLASWAAAVLGGSKKRPRQRGASPSKNVLRDSVMCWAIKAVSAKGIPATRNDASDPHSACDIIAGELRLRYKTVKGIWLNYLRSEKEREKRKKKLYPLTRCSPRLQ